MNKHQRLAVALAAAIGAAGFVGCSSRPPVNSSQHAALVSEAPVLGYEPVAKGVYLSIDRQPLTEEGLKRARMPRPAILAAVKAKALSTTETQPATEPATHPADARDAEPPPLAVKYYLQGRERFLEGANSEAMTYLEKALQLDPEAFTVLRLMGRVSFASSQLARGAMYLERAQQIRPQDVEVNYLLGRYWLERNDSERAIYYLMQAEDSPDRQITSTQTPLSAFYLGIALQQAGYHAAAAKEYEHFLELAEMPVPGYRYDAELSYLIAMQWASHLAAAENDARFGDYRAALPHYRIAAAARPEDVFIASRLVNALVRDGKTPEAHKAALALLSATKGDEDAIALLGWTYRATGREGDLIGDLNVYLRSRANGPESDESAALTLAATQDYLGKNAAAFATLRSFVDKHPTNLAVLGELLSRADAADTFGKALQASASAIVADPKLSPDVLKLFLPVAEGPAGAAYLKGGSSGERNFAASYLEALTARAHDEPPDFVERAFRSALQSAPSDFFAAREAFILWLLAQEKFPQATELIQQSLTAEPGNAKASQLQVQSESVQQRYLHALQLAQEAKARFPDNADTRMQLVAVYRLRGQDKEADAELQSIIRDMPKYEPAYRALINSLLVRSQNAGAGGGGPETSEAAITAALNKLAQEVPASRFGRVTSSLIYARKGRLDEADEMLRAVLASEPDDVDALILDSRIRQALQRPEEADALLEASLKRKPRVEIARSLAELYRVQNRAPDALSLTRRLMEQNAGADAFALLCAGEMVNQRLTQEAAALLADLTKKFPRSESAAVTLARLQEQNNDHEAALNTMLAFIKTDGESSERLYLLSHFYTATGNDDASVAALQKVLSIMPDHVGANNDLGYFWADAGIHLDQAEPMIRKAVENKPDDSAFLDSLGWLCYKQGKFTEAAELLGRAIALPGGAEPEVVQHLGDALYRLGRTDIAVERWTLAMQMLGSLEPLSKTDQKVHDYLSKALTEARAGRQPDLSPTALPAQPKAAGPATAPAAISH